MRFGFDVTLIGEPDSGRRVSQRFNWSGFVVWE